MPGLRLPQFRSHRISTCLLPRSTSSVCSGSRSFRVRRLFSVAASPHSSVRAPTVGTSGTPDRDRALQVFAASPNTAPRHRCCDGDSRIRCGQAVPPSIPLLGRHQQRVGVGELADEKSIERVVEMHLPESIPGLSFTHVVDGRCPATPSPLGRRPGRGRVRCAGRTRGLPVPC